MSGMKRSQEQAGVDAINSAQKMYRYVVQNRFHDDSWSADDWPDISSVDKTSPKLCDYSSQSWAEAKAPLPQQQSGTNALGMRNSERFNKDDWPDVSTFQQHKNEDIRALAGMCSLVPGIDFSSVSGGAVSKGECSGMQALLQACMLSEGVNSPSGA